jgi:hypothetical protein
MKMMTTENELIKRLAKKYGITMQQVNDIVYSQDRFTVHIMENVADRDEVYFPTVRRIAMGIFYCPDKVKYALNKLKDEDKD